MSTILPSSCFLKLNPPISIFWRAGVQIAQITSHAPTMKDLVHTSLEQGGELLIQIIRPNMIFILWKAILRQIYLLIPPHLSHISFSTAYTLLLPSSLCNKHGCYCCLDCCWKNPVKKLDKVQACIQLTVAHNILSRII